MILLPNAVAWETFQEVVELSAHANGFKIFLSPGYYENLTTSLEVNHKAFVPLLRMGHARIIGVDLFLKGILDFGLGFVLMLLSLPIMIAIGLAIYISDGRPILERHPALGLAGVPFTTTRFRTGLLGTTRRRLGLILPKKIVENPRLSTRIGRFLYRTGLDKLPQLFDVLRGRMSLVGPRMVGPGQETTERPWLPNLLTIKPGWVGPWAVQDSATREEEFLRDLHYIRNWTIWLDLQVLFQAIRSVLGARSRRKR